MIRSVKDMQGYTIHASDGDIGKASEFYFDDDEWAVRYLVVDAGNWLQDRRVLISPIAIENVNWNEHRITMRLTREQIRNSPDIDTHMPISRQNEMRFHDYYRWPYYWAGAGLWGGGMYPGLLAGAPLVVPPAAPVEDKPTDKGNASAQENQDTHLHSTRDVIGYRIHARDGEIGHLSDFLIDDESWRINYMVIDTSNWWLGKKVIVPPTWVRQVSWSDQEINVDLQRDTIKNSPEFNPETLVNKA